MSNVVTNEKLKNIDTNNYKMLYRTSPHTKSSFEFAIVDHVDENILFYYHCVNLFISYVWNLR